MAQGWPIRTPGQTFASSYAPYPAYVRALGDEWDEARNLSLSLDKALDSLSATKCPWNPRTQSQSDSSTICSIIDIGADRGGASNKITVAAALRRSQLQGLHEGTVDADAADVFFSSLRYCEPDVHTRILVCQNSLQSRTQHERPIEAMFFSHVLGSELDLTPAYVCQLSQRKDIEELPRMCRYQNPTLIDACVKFQMSHGQSDNVAIYLGRKMIGNGSPHLGKRSSKCR